MWALRVPNHMLEKSENLHIVAAHEERFEFLRNCLQPSGEFVNRPMLMVDVVVLQNLPPGIANIDTEGFT
jgi:hypothetical protein